MRVDKYLWCVRYYKTRTMVTQACQKNQVSVNDQVVKASREVFAGDKISFRKDQITYTIRVLDIPDNRVGAKLVDIYRKDETPEEQTTSPPPEGNGREGSGHGSRITPP